MKLKEIIERLDHSKAKEYWDLEELCYEFDINSYDFI